jgi:hypothetical protein
MFEMFESYGKQITAFITQAQGVLTSLETEVKAMRVENSELKAQVTRIEGAHMLLMEWIADIDDSEAQELADAATLAAAESAASAEVAVAAAESAQEIAIEEVEEPPEEEEMQEAVPPAEKPAEGETPQLPETPVPDEPSVEPEQIPVKKNKRVWI